MTTTTKLVATALLAGGLLTTAGFGLTQGVGENPPAKAPRAADAAAGAMTDQAVRATLAKPSGVRELKGVSLDVLLHRLEIEQGIVIRLDLAAYKRLHVLEVLADNASDAEAEAAAFAKLSETKLAGRVSASTPLADLLTDVCAQLPGRHSYRVRGGQVLIGPAFLPPAVPGHLGEPDGPRNVEMRRVLEQVHGEPVSLSIEGKPFQDAIKELRRLTGANIVVNTAGDRLKGQTVLVTATFDDVRLHTALEVLGDLAGLKPVFLNNVYYLTSPEDAEKLQKKANEELFGRESKSSAVPAGYLTDGVNLYRNPGNLKPEPQAPGGGICGVGAAPTAGAKR